MLGWSINLFRIRGIRLSLHFSFLLLLAYVCQQGWIEGGLPGLGWSAGTFLAFFTCVVLHELGHSFTAMKFGVKVRRILLMPIGGMAEFDRIPSRPLQELLITAAGPAVNFAIAAVLLCVVGLPSGWSDGDATNSLIDVARTLVVWNVIMGCFNLIPAFPMDGGRILRALLAMRLPYLRATYWAVTVAKVVIPLGVIYKLLQPEQPGGISHYLTVAMGIFIFMAGQAEYRAVKRRQEEDDAWRQAIILHVSTEPLPEPPVLKG
jgi:Zn-dependent protease